MNSIKIDKHIIFYQNLKSYEILLNYEKKINIEFEFLSENNLKELYLNYIKDAINNNIEVNNNNNFIILKLKECYINSNILIMKGELV